MMEKLFTHLRIKNSRDKRIDNGYENCHIVLPYVAQITHWFSQNHPKMQQRPKNAKIANNFKNRPKITKNGKVQK